MRRRTVFIIVLNTLAVLVALELVARGMLWYGALIEAVPERQFGYSASGYGDLRPNLDSVERLLHVRPYFLQTNSVGLRNVEEVNDDPGVFRVLALGDSFVYGYYVHNQETFPARLEEVLNQRLSTHVQVLNAGAPGYTIADELSYLQDKGLKLEPDLVVFGFYTNDVFDFYPVIREHFARAVVLDQQPAEQSLTPAQRLLYENLGLFRVFWNAREAAFQGDIANLVNRATPTIEGLHRTYQDLTFLKPQDFPDEWQAYERTLRQTFALLQEQGIPAVIIAFPDLAQLPVPGGLPDVPQQMLVRVTAEIGMPYLDLLPVFREAGDIQSLYLMYYKDDAGFDPDAPDAAVMTYTGDGHPSPYGYLVTARAVADLLIARNLVPLRRRPINLYVRHMLFELDLTTMAHGGSALGRHEGRAIFVPYAIPGERITARITRDRGRFASAEVVSVLAPSEARVEPRCPHFGPGRCGGCHWQHIDYPAQLAFKRQVVIDQMARIGGFRDVNVHPTIPCPDPWRYRSHISFHVTDDGRLGFVSTDDRTVIPIEECHIIRPELLEVFNDLKRRLKNHSRFVFSPLQSGEGAGVRSNIERVRLQVGSDGADRLIAIVDGGRVGDEGSEHVHYTIKGRTFRVSAGSFFQVNLAQAEALVDLATERLALRGAERVLDLYSGVGLFTAFLAERAAHVTSVEDYPLAVRDARHNLAEFRNVRLVQGTVEAFLSDSDEAYDDAVLDPPRAGVDAKALAGLVRRAPARIVYVSCDPATLARDARRLAEAGYDLLDVQPVDMFPQTYHVESVAAFVKRTTFVPILENEKAV